MNKADRARTRFRAGYDRLAEEYDAAKADPSRQDEAQEMARKLARARIILKLSLDIDQLVDDVNDARDR